MIHTMFYMISPKPDLIAAAKGARDEVASRLSPSLLWTGELHDKGPIIPAEMAQLIKGLFLLDLCGMPDVASFIGALGDGEIKISLTGFG